MSLIAFGINHNSASIDIRERLSFMPEALPEAMTQIRQEKIAKEVVIFSTCNRTELYLADANDAHSVYEWMSDYHKVDLPLIREHSYLYHNNLASKHLFRVATGLDSLALGEPQILGQIKAAYQTSLKTKNLDKTLNRLFQEAFYVAKNVRKNTKLGENPISIAYAAVKLSSHFYTSYNDLTALIIGAGQTAQLAAKSLHKKGVSKFIIANRTLSRAQDLALELGGYATVLSRIGCHIHEADIIVSATSKPDIVVSEQMMAEAQKKRKQKKQLLLDLAVPRDIDGNVKNTSNCYLYSVDDLQDIIKKNKELRMQAAEQAEQMIELYNQNFVDWLQLRQHHTLIRDIHQFGQSEKDRLVDIALSQLDKGADAKEIINTLAHKLTKKLMHQPSLIARKASEQGNAELLDEIKSTYNFK